MKILSIGNSFSEDATTYLHDIAASQQVGIETYNLYIGGCTLARHMENVKTKEKCYALYRNGIKQPEDVSITDMFPADVDVITLQQASRDSVRYETFEPYLGQLLSYVKENAKEARIVLHETWGYKEGSKRLTEELGYKSTDDMCRDIRANYRKAYTSHSEFDGMIPSAEAMLYFEDAGYPALHRDDFHAFIPDGRYILGCTWFHFLTGLAVAPGGFLPGQMDEKTRDYLAGAVNSGYDGWAAALA